MQETPKDLAKVVHGSWNNEENPKLGINYTLDY